MRKHIIAFILTLIIVAGCMVGCNTQEQTDKEESSYQVIKSIRSEEGWVANFEYNSKNNSVTVTYSDNSADVLEKYLLFVNKDGAITSIYRVEDRYQETLFEDDPETIFNDAGGIETIVYEDVKVTFSYNNYIDNILTSVSYSESGDWGSWEDENQYTAGDIYYTFKIDIKSIKYKTITDQRFRLFDNIIFFLSFMRRM